MAAGLVQVHTPHVPGPPLVLSGSQGQLPRGHHPYCRSRQLHSRSLIPFFHAGIPAGGPWSGCSAHTPPHPCTADRGLTEALAALQRLGVAPSTRRTYSSGIARFRQFCAQHNLLLLPASSLTLRYFCAHLSTSLQHATIKTYLSAIRLLYIESGLPDPTQDTLLQYVVRGIKRLQSGPAAHTRLPVTIHVLKDLKRALHDTNELSLHNKRMLWAAFCTAFYGFLRASELCSPSSHSFDHSSTLCCSDVTVSPTAARVNIKASKTDPFRRGCVVTLGVTSTSTCPVAALTNYRTLPSTSPSPLFTFADGSFLTREKLTAHLRTLLTASGYKAEKYASHSFRIGAATTAALAGLPDWQIQALGRWSSDCYTRYIRSPPEILAQASRRLAVQTQPAQHTTQEE